MAVWEVVGHLFSCMFSLPCVLPPKIPLHGQLMWNPEAIQDKGAEGAAGVLLTKAEVTMVITPCPVFPLLDPIV